MKPQMQTSLPNSKKCSTVEPKFSFALPVIYPSFLLFAASAWASIPPSLGAKLQSEIHGRSKHTFLALLRHWEQDYGVKAVDPLLQLAKNIKREDSERYVALMGASKLGGTGNAAAIIPFLKDRSWMIRSGALNALSLLRDSKTADAVLPLLDDKALVVRLQAVEAVRALRPKGAEEALAKAACQNINFHGGKAQWVPEHALSALVALKAKSIAPKLAPLLDKTSDPGIQRRTIEALEALTGKTTRKDLSLWARTQEWKKILAAKI